MIEKTAFVYLNLLQADAMKYCLNTTIYRIYSLDCAIGPDTTATLVIFVFLYVCTFIYFFFLLRKLKLFLVRTQIICNVPKNQNPFLEHWLVNWWYGDSRKWSIYWELTFVRWIDREQWKKYRIATVSIEWKAKRLTTFPTFQTSFYVVSCAIVWIAFCILVTIKFMHNVYIEILWDEL